jgi:predicted N-acetyltransferase YhbS
VDPRIQIRALERSDVREWFECGEPALDVFIRQYAGQNQWRHHIAVTYVAVEDSTRAVVGFVTVAAAILDSARAGNAGVSTGGFSQVPALRIARLAVDRRFHGLGLGDELMRFAMQIAVIQADLSGCVGVIVDAKPSAVEYYDRFGFRALVTLRGGLAVRPRQSMLYLGLGKIKAALEE